MREKKTQKLSWVSEQLLREGYTLGQVVQSRAIVRKALKSCAMQPCPRCGKPTAFLICGDCDGDINPRASSV